MLFIAELNGYGKGTAIGKLEYGIQCYANRKLHTLNLAREADRGELHENIWLERLYDELDDVHGVSTPEERVLALNLDTVSNSTQWTVPLECDATASMLQIMGALLGSKSLLSMTNCIVDNDELDDAWGVIDGVPRLAVKTIMTPRLYGSSVEPIELLAAESKLEGHDIHSYANKIMNSPAYKLADMFKEFILAHVQPHNEMELHVWDEKFTVRCNHYKQVGEYTKYYKAWDTTDNKEKMFRNVHTKQVADLKRFVRYFVTGLIHNLDSQIADAVSEKISEKYGWIICIHDAYLIPAQAADDCKKWYAEKLTEVYENRSTILTNYFKSIGIGAKAARDWQRLVEHIDKVDSFVCSPYALK